VNESLGMITEVLSRMVAGTLRRCELEFDYPGVRISVSFYAEEIEVEPEEPEWPLEDSGEEDGR
jgi:hypothetical protein